MVQRKKFKKKTLKRGPKQRIDDERVRKLHNKGYSIGLIAETFGFSRSGIQVSLKRSSK